ncbi:MAG: hypothetical protein ACP5VE_13710 [Chthonomonadales bacterium]
MTGAATGSRNACLQCVVRAFAAAVLWLAMGMQASATTKGLNQIVTPDIQPAGLLSLSLQWQERAIGNPLQIQYEIGLVRGLEAAAFQGLQPGETSLAVEGALLQKGSWTLSAGSLGIGIGKGSAQPFVEGGYALKWGTCICGVLQNRGSVQVLAGVLWQVSPRLAGQLDHQGGAGNFTTIGFTWYATPAFSVNPAVYLSNDGTHSAHAYVVATWNIRL